MAKPSEIRGLSPNDPVVAAAAKIVWTRFEDMWALRTGVLNDLNVEGIHDMRVASRRLRTAMQTFRPCFPGKRYRAHYRRIREVADLLGEVRDRDVLLEELQGDVARLAEDGRAGVSHVMERLHAEREEHRVALCALLERLERTAYDRAFLTYIARQAG